MAVRLTVIMIQSNPPTAGAQRMAEAVVGELIGAEGIDLTLIGPLSSLAETATDRLTLESISGDVAALDWQDPETIVRGLAAVNFLAHRAPHPHDDDVPTPAMGTAPALGSRRVYAFDMNRFRVAGELIEALKELNARRQVRTFTIGPGSIAPRSSDVPGANSHPATPPQVDQKVKIATSRSVTSQVIGVSGVTGSPEAGEVVPHSNSQASSPRTGLDLDDLLDQLDQADP